MSGSPLGPRPTPYPHPLQSPTSPLQPESFLYLLHSDSGRPLFFEQLRNSLTEHHLLFWEQVQQYRRCHQPQSPTELRPATDPPVQTPLEKARYIHTKFISPGAQLQINITEQVRTRIQSTLAPCDASHQPPLGLFDESEVACLEMMKGNYFHTFKETRDYSDWLAKEKKAQGKKVRHVVQPKRKQHRMCAIL